MIELGFLGGRLGRERSLIRLSQLGEVVSWQASHDETMSFLQASGERLQIDDHDDVAVLLRGLAVVKGSLLPPSSVELAALIRHHYIKHGEFPVDRFEGSFLAVIVDGRSGRVLLFRNLVGGSNIYYTETRGGIVFSSNLAALIDALGGDVRPNLEALPAYFLFRYVPGRETLAEGVYRLMPGEQLMFDGRGLSCVQRQTLADFEASSSGQGFPATVDEAMASVLLAWADTDPRAANLLSGGVDSSYIQAVWRRVRLKGDVPPRTFTVSLDHPITRDDDHYAISAARMLGADHTLIRVDEPFSVYLLETIASTGEPLNHAQCAYFNHLARAMSAQGFATGLCGEGADGLFGVGSATTIQYARMFERLVPARVLRRLGSRLAAALGRTTIQAAFDLAGRVDDLEHLEHPANQISAFTEWPMVTACFGAQAVAAGAARRRLLLEQYGVPREPLQQLHASGFLGEAIDSAALWTTIFNANGVELACPFLDSRVLRATLSLDVRERFPFRRPKDVLRRSLVREGLAELAYREKRGFGQPVLEWMKPEGALRPLIDRIGEYGFLPRHVLRRSRETPGWFLYNLLCYDIWYKYFIERSLARPHTWPVSEVLPVECRPHHAPNNGTGLGPRDGSACPERP
jgi:asparagine synthase (glutamine-hydrolysing)